MLDASATRNPTPVEVELTARCFRPAIGTVVGKIVPRHSAVEIKVRLGQLE